MLTTIACKVCEAALEKQRKKQNSPYWCQCPCCGKEVVVKQLHKTGCFVCGFIPHDEPASSLPHSKAGQKVFKSFRTVCPQCKTKVIRREMEENGCFVCGYRPGRPAGSKF